MLTTLSKSSVFGAARPFSHSLRHLVSGASEKHVNFSTESGSTDRAATPPNDASKPIPSITHTASQFSNNEHRSAMRKYLSSSHFRFPEDRASKSLDRLRESMELVYPRERPLVAIDVEAWERNLSKVTEIGIAVYDPLESEGSIFPVLQSIHVIVKENIGKLNGRFVPDNKHKHLGGTSYVLTFPESRQLVDQILTKFIAHRGGALVGHNLDGDIKWIKSIGVELPKSVPSVDTHKLYSISRPSGGTLRGVLRLANIPHALLHNAANDAYYTLVAAMAYCDPQVRVRHHLDVYEEPEAKSKSEKRQEKFSDAARLVDDPQALFEQYR